MSKFQNKYRVESTRLKNWDYRNPGAYYVTICTKDRKYYFGDIIDEKMVLSPIGIIGDIMWHEIKNHASNVTLGEYIVMPNHVHGIIILRDRKNCVETGHTLSLQGDTTKNLSLSNIIGGYKSAVSKHAHRLGYEFQWQERFWDHIIRDEKSFEKISEYIINNPVNWQADKFFGKDNG
jgi:REP element-mobilizing transposase RayT